MKQFKDDRGRLDDAGTRLEDKGVPAPESAEEIEFFEIRLKNSECKLRRHEVMLRWIEQQRTAMIAE